MRKVLVTGGGGFVGLAVVARLAAEKVETTVVGRHHYRAAEALGARCLVGDIRDPHFMDRATAGCDTVFHVAAKAGIWGSRNDYFSINVGGTENVISACRKHGVRSLIHTSTPSVVFDGRSIEGGDESLPYSRKPLCHYAASKIVAEQKVLAANGDGLRTVALRPHLVWGPQDTQIIPRLLERGRRGTLRMVGGGGNRVDISYIDNVAAAHILAARNLEESGSAAGQPFFISQGEPVVLWGWINELFDRVGIPRVRKEISFRTAYRLGWLFEKLFTLLRLENEPQMTRFLAEQLAESHWFSIERARLVLAYRPEVPTGEGVDRLVRWLETSVGAEKEQPRSFFS
ncbi:MAG TPA: NAD-dependent epimerase/dehydratase family protein [Desulfobacteraceae bacterium]|nr:NAD-dependent epimerase/dehydratase family protein [Desulfobacteraceae bacterium]